MKEVLSRSEGVAGEGLMGLGLSGFRVRNL